MNLTFEGFLRGYLRELSGVDTTNLRTLCSMAADDVPRLAEPLFLFALSKDKVNYLARLSRGTWMEDEYGELATLAKGSTDAEAFASQDEVPERYRNVARAYRARKESAQADRRVSSLMREKTLAAMRENGSTCYRLCKDLGLNMGNIYAYLNKGDASKVSRATARRIMEYATKH